MIKSPSFLIRLVLLVWAVAGFWSFSQAQWTLPTIGGLLPNSATGLADDCFELVSGTNQRGAVWNNVQMDLSQPFDITLSVWHDVHGADGLALVLQNFGLGAHGAGGNANGYATAVPASAYPGINPSVAVELDLFFNNVAGVNDIPADHVAIHVNGDLSAAAAGPAAAIPNGNPIPDNQCFPLRVRWTPAPTNQMEVYWNNQLRITWTNDIVNTVFGGNPSVFWGLTGSCGSVAMTQRVCVGANFAQAGPDVSMCLGDTIQLNASGGTGYLWGLGAPVISNTAIPNPLFSPNLAQTYDIPLTVTNIVGCTDRDTVRVNVRPRPNATIQADPSLCLGTSGQVAVNATGGTTPYTYLWNTGSTQQSFTQTFSIPGPNTFVVTVTDAFGCERTVSQVVTVDTLEFVDILNNDTVLCLGAGISNLNVTMSSGVTQMAWTPTAGVTDPTIATPSLVPQVSTTYYLTVTNGNTGCTGVDSIRIDVFDLQAPGIQDTTICQGDTVRFDVTPSVGSGDYTYTWVQAGADPLSNDSTANPFMVGQNGGTYSYTIVDNQSGCKTTDLANVTVRRLQVTATPASILINPGQRVQLEAFGAMFYSWEPDTMLNCANCPSPVSMPGSSITYTVTGTDTTGCIGTADVIIVTDSLLIPNVFTPNGDGANDELLLNYYGNGFYQITIYDRWGHQIFETQDKQVMWDGKTKGGADAPEGVYYLAVRVVGDAAIPQKDKQKLFAVTLMR